MPTILDANGDPIDLEAEVARLRRELDTAKRGGRSAPPPRPSERALRHRRENSAAKAKKSARKRTRA